MPQKYTQQPDAEIDLHGHTMLEAGEVLGALVREGRYTHVRVITGKGRNSENGPVLPDFVRNFLSDRGIRYNQSKIQDGGEGALEVFF